LQRERLNCTKSTGRSRKILPRRICFRIYCGSDGSGTISLIVVRNDVAVIDDACNIRGARDQNGHAAPQEKGLFTEIAKKEGDRWFIVAQREVVPATAIRFAREALKPLHRSVGCYRERP